MQRWYLMKRYICKKNVYKNNNNCNKPSASFGQKKENILCSLNQVENFLCNFSKALRCFKFYSFFK